ncbi:hypothetical protein [Petrachloros mirabilis]
MAGYQKKLTALAVLGLLWGGLLVWLVLTGEEPVRVPLTNVTGPSREVPRTRDLVEGLRVRIDLLRMWRKQQEMAFETPRNIFAFPASNESNEDKTTELSDLAVRQQAVAAELAQFHYLGFVRTGEGWRKRQKLAVLTKNDDLHIVQKGEIVDNHVLVRKITRDGVTLQDRESRVEYTVMLSEEPLAQ